MGQKNTVVDLLYELPGRCIETVRAKVKDIYNQILHLLICRFCQEPFKGFFYFFSGFALKFRFGSSLLKGLFELMQGFVQILKPGLV